MNERLLSTHSGRRDFWFNLFAGIVSRMRSRLPGGGGLAGFVAGTIFAIVPGMLVLGFAAVIAGHSDVLMGLSIALVLSLSVAFGLLVRKLVNRFVHRQR